MNRARRCSLRLLPLLSVVALAACGIENSLVDGRCADGLERAGTTCIRPGPTLIGPGETPGGSPAAPSEVGGQVTVDGGAPDGVGTVQSPVDQRPEVDLTPPWVTDRPELDAGPTLVCTKPLVACRGECIPVAVDAMNCGACGKICPSNICLAGECQGATPGDVVLIGHEFTGALSGSAQAKVLLNALSIPTTDPIRVLSYEIGAPEQAVVRVKEIAASGVYGRKVQFTHAYASSLESGTLSQTYDVVLLHDVTSDDPVALGERWAASLGRFAAKGGVVVALDSGVSPMPTVLTSTGLLSVGGHTKLPEHTHLVVAAAADVVGAQVLSPYSTIGSPVAFQGVDPNGTELAWVVRRDDVSGAGEAIVVHRVVR